MQPMTAKNRTAALVGVALLALMVGGFGLWSARKSVGTKPGADTVAINDGAATAASTTPQTGMPQTATTSPATGTGATVTPSTPSSLAPDDAAGAATKLPTTYVVHPGDTLSIISQKFYNSDKYYGDIEAANELEDANHLMVGQTLTIPDVAQPAAAQGH